MIFCAALFERESPKRRWKRRAKTEAEVFFKKNWNPSLFRVKNRHTRILIFDLSRYIHPRTTLCRRFRRRPREGVGEDGFFCLVMQQRRGRPFLETTNTQNQHHQVNPSPQNNGGGGFVGSWSGETTANTNHHHHHQQHQPYLSPQHKYSLLDDSDDEGGGKKRRRGRGFGFVRRTLGAFGWNGAFKHFRKGSDGTVNPFAVIFFLLFAYSYFRWSRVTKKFELFKSNADGSMRRFKELSGSRERRCLETLEDREREMGELRAAVHSKEKDVESVTHQFNACELKLIGHHEEKKLSGNEKSNLKQQLESLRHEKENLIIEMNKWKDEAGSAKDELAALKKHHELDKHDAGVKHEADFDVIDGWYNAVIDNEGVLHEHTDEEYEELKRAFEAISKKHNLEHKEYYYESTEPHNHREKSHEPLETHPEDGHHNNIHHVEHVESTDVPDHRKSVSHSIRHEEGEDDNRPLWERYGDVEEETLKKQ